MCANAGGSTCSGGGSRGLAAGSLAEGGSNNGLVVLRAPASHGCSLIHILARSAALHAFNVSCPAHSLCHQVFCKGLYCDVAAMQNVAYPLMGMLNAKGNLSFCLLQKVCSLSCKMVDCSIHPYCHLLSLIAYLHDQV